jgi:hypothetical protein
MPQIWVTYQELSTLFGCSETDARKLANKQKLDRAIGRDGQSRVKLCSVGVTMFAERLRRPDETFDRAIERQSAHAARMKASFESWRSYYPWIS